MTRESNYVCDTKKRIRVLPGDEPTRIAISGSYPDIDIQDNEQCLFIKGAGGSKVTASFFKFKFFQISLKIQILNEQKENCNTHGTLSMNEYNVTKFHGTVSNGYCDFAMDISTEGSKNKEYTLIYTTKVNIQK